MDRKLLNQLRLRRKKRTRVKILGTADKPRLSVFRSNKWTYVQLIDDQGGVTLISASTREIKKSSKDKNPQIALAKELGELIAKKAGQKGIKKAIVDRGDYKYHGRVRAVAEGARGGGLQI